jgi:hypothetical protein
MNWYKKAQIMKGVSGKEADDIEKQIRDDFLKLYPEEPTIPPLSQFIRRPEDRKCCKLVNIDVEKFDKLFQNNTDQYIGKGGTDNFINGRYKGFQDFLRTKEPIQASTVGISELYNQAQFTNGRHRYSVLRDMGMKIMPVAMYFESIPVAKKLGLIT